MNEEQASVVIRKIFNECVDDFSRMQLKSDESTDLRKQDFSQNDNQKQSQTLSQVRRAFDDLVGKIESGSGDKFEESAPV